MPARQPIHSIPLGYDGAGHTDTSHGMAMGHGNGASIRLWQWAMAMVPPLTAPSAAILVATERLQVLGEAGSDASRPCPREGRHN